MAKITTTYLRIILAVVLLIILCIGQVSLRLVFLSVEAAVMESENYKIQFDSINIGGERQTSESYIMEDTIGEIATGASSSDNYNLYAGYQQMNETYISLSGGANVTMSSMTRTNATSTGSTSWTVVTDNLAGYKLEITAATSTCNYYLCDLSTGVSFDDYRESSGTTPEVWNTANGSYEFGFSAYGDDVSDNTWGAGDSCGSGTTIPQDLKYRGFNNANDSGPDTIEIATRSSRTDSSGISTTFCLGAVQSGTFAPTGTYRATTTATATAL